MKQNECKIFIYLFIFTLLPSLFFNLKCQGPEGTNRPHRPRSTAPARPQRGQSPAPPARPGHGPRWAGPSHSRVLVWPWPIPSPSEVPSTWGWGCHGPALLLAGPWQGPGCQTLHRALMCNSKAGGLHVLVLQKCY